MPERVNRPCTYPGCATLVKLGRCAKHARAARIESDHRRPTARARGYGDEWRKLRASILRKEPLCRACREAGVKPIPIASDVDHIIPRDAGGSDDPSNLQPLCKPCHSAKTAREDGGFGNDKRPRNEAEIDGRPRVHAGISPDQCCVFRGSKSGSDPFRSDFEP